jgi:molybdenum cofactor cytidylyltransferase
MQTNQKQEKTQSPDFYTSIIPVILAAGRSERMGSPKPYLKLNNKTFLEIITEKLRMAGISSTGIIVINEIHKELFNDLHLDGFKSVINNRQELGQIYSLQLAIKECPAKCSGILVCLSDHPFVPVNIYQTIKEHHKKFPHKILIPVFKGKRGHPVFFPGSLFPEFLELSPELPGGARNIIQNHRSDIMELKVETPRIHADLDTPEDLKKWQDYTGKV